jgi:hypothetical protein
VDGVRKAAGELSGGVVARGEVFEEVVEQAVFVVESGGGGDYALVEVVQVLVRGGWVEFFSWDV